MPILDVAHLHLMLPQPHGRALHALRGISFKLERGSSLGLVGESGCGKTLTALALMGLQVLRPGAAEGRIEGPPYHLDIHLLRALLPASRWDWPAPPYAAVPHPRGWRELAIVLVRR